MTQVTYNTISPPITQVSEKENKEAHQKIKKRLKNWMTVESLNEIKGLKMIN